METNCEADETEENKEIDALAEQMAQISSSNYERPHAVNQNYLQGMGTAPPERLAQVIEEQEQYKAG